jgi:3-dehydroquinate synthase
MKCNVAAFLSAIAVSQVSGFVTKAADHSLGRITTTSKNSLTSRAFIPSASAVSSSAMNMATVADTDVDYDIVKVDLSDDRDYPIYIGAEFDDAEAGKIIRSHIKGNRALLITNDLLEPMYLEKYENMLKEGGGIQIDTLVLPDGEANKTMEVLQLVFDKCLTLGLDRKVTFIALGGGVIGDMVGFASAIYQRGVNFIQIPTTVMSMVDSSVGGKTGVNHPLGKNMIGAFHQPQCVFIDTKNLATLPDREMYSGVAEVIKYGLIRDAPFFEWLETNMDKLNSRDPAALRYAIKTSCENKAAVVKEDELEAGVRATLNLGHTFGHAIENGSGYGAWLHGEAVSIGTVMAATMSAKMGWIDQPMVQRIYDILVAANCPTDLPVDSPMNKEIFLKAMSVDKKVANGQLRLILLKGALGECVFTGDFDEDAMVETIDEFVAECKGAQ